MSPEGISEAPVVAGPSRPAARPPRTLVALSVAAAALVVIALSAWLAVKPGAEARQTGLVLWFNDPPQPVAAVLALTNPLLRPVPLLLVSAVLIGWVVLGAGGTTQRKGTVRSLLIAVALGELVAQVMKRLADQPRPLSVVPGLDVHGYPTEPNGNAYPSAHVAMVVAAVCATWPWMRRPQRVVMVAFAALVAANRLYVGAHWPVDVLGGAAIGLLSGSLTWLVAARRPVRG